MKKTTVITILITAIMSIVAFEGCKQPEPEPTLHIAVSKLGKNYQRWLLETDSTLILHNLYETSVDSALEMLETCHALLVTGGEDVFPQWHNKLSDTLYCEGYDRWRDTLELQLINKAFELKMPVLGICRGHQITNVALGGNLITDIPTQAPSEILHRCPVESPICLHDVNVVEGSLMYEITGQKQGLVTSYHHQAVDMLAPGLKISALASDGIVEAFEWMEAAGKSFLLGVQWHPERMKDYPQLSVPIAERFLKEAKTFKNKK